MSDSQHEQSETLRALLRQRREPGRVHWIGIRPALGAPMVALDEIELIAERGLRGDRATANSGGKRQVSLLQAEHLPVIASLVGRAQIEPQLLRRNLVISGINLAALRATTFRVGAAVLQGSGDCAPCSKMEAALGLGGYNALRGHGGIVARVLTGGVVRVGDEVDFAPDAFVG